MTLCEPGPLGCEWWHVLDFIEIEPYQLRNGIWVTNSPQIKAKDSAHLYKVNVETGIIEAL